MRLPEEVRRVQELAEAGFNLSQISRETGISRETIRRWLATERHLRDLCSRCGHERHDFGKLAPAPYAYLLGIYLGDGSIARLRKNVWALRIFQDSRYPEIIEEIAAAMAAVMPTNRVAVFPKHKVGTAP